MRSTSLMMAEPRCGKVGTRDFTFEIPPSERLLFPPSSQLNKNGETTKKSKMQALSIHTLTTQPFPKSNKKLLV